MGNCRSTATTDGEAADAPPSQAMGRVQGPRMERVAEEEPRSQTRASGYDTDWQQAADGDDLWRESENASMSSCPMGPRNGTTAMYESPLVLGRYSSMFPSGADDGKVTPKRSLAYDTTPSPPPGAEGASPFQSVNVPSDEAAAHLHPALPHAAAEKSQRPFLIRPSDTHADPVDANIKMVAPDVDSVCSQNSGSGPLSSDRTMTFRTTSTGHFEAVRSWLVTVDSTSDTMSSERTESLSEVPASAGIAVR